MLGELRVEIRTQFLGFEIEMADVVTSETGILLMTG
jgi:hypothetical protein